MSAVVEWKPVAFARIRDATIRGLFRCAEELLTLTVPEVPVDVTERARVRGGGGTLLRSGTVSRELGERVAAVVGYNTPYARVQHEEYPRKSKPGAKTKYLEDPAKRYAGVIENRMKALTRLP